MRTPILWIWAATFLRSFSFGCDYFCLRRGSLRDAWFVAGVVSKACLKIRRQG